jgi:membrane-associated phospholipid phosphatase
MLLKIAAYSSPGYNVWSNWCRRLRAGPSILLPEKRSVCPLRDAYRRAIPYVLGVYIFGVGAGFLFFNMRLTVEWVAIILFVAAVLSGRGLLFLRDWGVFIAVLLAWQLASPLATRFSFPWHLQAMISADKLMFFGTVPPVWLQKHLYHPGVLEPWDVLAAVVYMLHFLAPLLSGFLLWMTNRELFRKFAITFVLVAIGGFVTYIVYPAVPPWLAAQPLVSVGNQYAHPWEVANSYPGGLHAAWAHSHVFLPGVRDLFNIIASRWYNPYHGTIFFAGLHLHYDQVAAIPSEHAMYPLLFFLFLRRQFGRWAYLALVYIGLVLFSITYLGQHYAVDAVVGFAYAIAGYVLVMQLWPRIVGRRSRNAKQAQFPTIGLRELEEA